MAYLQLTKLTSSPSLYFFLLLPNLRLILFLLEKIVKCEVLINVDTLLVTDWS